MVAVWFSDAKNKETIVAFSGSRETATTLANRTYHILVHIEKRTQVSVGLYRMDQDIIYTSQKPKRCVVLPLSTSLN